MYALLIVRIMGGEMCGPQAEFGVLRSRESVNIALQRTFYLVD